MGNREIKSISIYLKLDKKRLARLFYEKKVTAPPFFTLKSIDLPF